MSVVYIVTEWYVSQSLNQYLWVWESFFKETIQTTNDAGSDSVSWQLTVTIADSDNDGMLDKWEDQYNGLNSFIDDASEDIDGDGFTNLQEYLAGTNSTDENSRPIIKGAINADGSVDLADAILALKISVGISWSDVYSNRDVNEDGRIGIEEVIYILQKISGLR